MTTPSTTSRFDELEDALSRDRLARYLAWSAGDRSDAIDLYTLNARISESLYTPLQMMEVALRNRIHCVLSEMHGAAWMLDERNLLGDHQRRQVLDAIAQIERANREPTPARIVAALSLGFWTAMFGRVYENAWRDGLHRIARRADGKRLGRKDLATRLMKIRELRNRVAHHEPVLHWDLHGTNRLLLQVTRWLSPPAARWCAEHSRFARTCPFDLHLEIRQRRAS